MANTKALFGVACIILLTIVSYPILNGKIASAEVQALSWGPALLVFTPVMLTAFCLLFSVVLVIVAFRGAVPK